MVSGIVIWWKNLKWQIERLQHKIINISFGETIYLILINNHEQKNTVSRRRF